MRSLYTVLILLGCCSLLSAAPSAHAQAPLFAADDVIRFTLEADFSALLDDRGEDNPERPAILTLPIADGAAVELDVQLRTRGNFRLKKATCQFPPLRLNVKKKQVKGTVFEGQDKLKMVNHCNTRRDEFQQYVLHEYLVYRAFNQLTDYSFRVRLAEVTYRDTAGDMDEITRYAFLIEDEDAMAERLGGIVQDVQGVPQIGTQRDQMLRVAVFQYMIGNTDWAVSAQHNIKLLFADPPNTPYVIPYDFDWSGIVSTRYARPRPELNLRTVRERLFLGLCRPAEDFEPIVALFNDQREAIYALFDTFELLDTKRRRKTRAYLDDFYAVINDRRDLELDFVYNCRDID